VQCFLADLFVIFDSIFAKQRKFYVFSFVTGGIYGALFSLPGERSDLPPAGTRTDK
jgi:hypothetical protein